MENNLNLKSKKQKEIEYIKNLSKKECFKIWVKTLLCSMKIFPEIIRTIDKIIVLQASSLSFASDIFNTNKTLEDAEQIIDLSERKNSILNIYLMTESATKNLPKEDYEFITKKYLEGYKNDELAEEYQISPRTVYRKTEKIIENICRECRQNNWSLELIESQTKGESWLKEKFEKNAIEYIKSSNYKPLTQNL